MVSDSPPEAGMATTRPAPSKAYRGWLLFNLFLLTALNLADRQGMAAIAPAVKHDLGLSDTQLGMILGLGFAIFFALMALPVARLAEHHNRTRIIAAAAGVFGIALGLCSLAGGFWQFLLLRIGVGSGESGLGPPTASLLGDHFPREKRASANTVVWLGAPVGAVGGAILGGMFAQYFGWRLWFLALGAPALIVAALCFLTLRDPPRGTFDPARATAHPPPMLEVLRFLWAKRSVRQILIGAGLAAISLNALGQFFARFFVSNFHLGLAQAGAILGMMAGTSMASGMALGGFGLDWAARSDRRWYVWGPAIGLGLATPLFVIGLGQPGLYAVVGILLIAHVALFVFWTPTMALAQNMVGADMRASSQFVVSLVISLVGIGLGPTLAGILSDAFAKLALPHFSTLCPGGLPMSGATEEIFAACLSASAEGVRTSIITMSLVFAWAGVHYFLAARTLRQDLDTHYEARIANSE
jgi:predicted MFS family arabinose efflux permease